MWCGVVRGPVVCTFGTPAAPERRTSPEVSEVRIGGGSWEKILGSAVANRQASPGESIDEGSAGGNGQRWSEGAHRE